MVSDAESTPNSRGARRIDKAKARVEELAHRERMRASKRTLKAAEDEEKAVRKAAAREKKRRDQAIKDANKKTMKKWDPWEVRRFLDLRFQWIHTFADIDEGSASTRWERFAKELETPGYKSDGVQEEPILVTAQQCKSKWNNLCTKYKAYKDERRDGTDLSSFDYVEEMDRIMGNDPNVDPIQGHSTGEKDDGLQLFRQQLDSFSQRMPLNHSIQVDSDDESVAEVVDPPSSSQGSRSLLASPPKQINLSKWGSPGRARSSDMTMLINAWTSLEADKAVAKKAEQDRAHARRAEEYRQALERREVDVQERAKDRQMYLEMLKIILENKS